MDSAVATEKCSVPAAQDTHPYVKSASVTAAVYVHAPAASHGADVPSDTQAAHAVPSVATQASVTTRSLAGKVPPGQAQSSKLSDKATANRPVGQDVHDDAPAAEYVSTGQPTHDSGPVEKLPAGHDMHGVAAALSSSYMPAAQVSQLVEPRAAYEPAPHSAH